MSTRPVRYHPALVAQHWLVAVLLVLEMSAGFFLAQRPNEDPGKIDGLRVHMAMGMGILFLMLVRLVVGGGWAGPTRRKASGAGCISASTC